MQYPAYDQEIEVRIDLNDISEKISRYTSVSMFVEDVLLLVNNTKMFFKTRDPEKCKRARELSV